MGCAARLMSINRRPRGLFHLRLFFLPMPPPPRVWLQRPDRRVRPRGAFGRPVRRNGLLTVSVVETRPGDRCAALGLVADDLIGFSAIGGRAGRTRGGG
jgi:hypothetical protein